jgi:KxYKxGKxW signal domain protein
MEQNKDNKRWIMMAITTVMIILIGSLGVNYVVNQQQKDKENKK